MTRQGRATRSALARHSRGYDYGDEFEWGLDLILDGVERSFDAPEA